MPRHKQTTRPKTTRGSAANQRIEFCYHPNLNTPEGEVYQYLLRNPVWSTDQGKAMANESVLNRFLPYARQQNRPALARSTAQHSVRQLLRYIDELCRDFDLDNPLTTTRVSVAAPPSYVPSAVATVPSEAEVDVQSNFGKFDVFEGDE